MLYIIIVTFLIASNGISRIQSEEQGYRSVQPSGTQTSNTQFRTNYALSDPGYPWVTYVKSEEHDLPRQPTQNQIPSNRTGIILGSEVYQIGNNFKVEPGSQKVFGAITDLINQVFKFVGSKNQTQPNGGDIHYGSSTVQINNTFTTNDGVKTSYGSHQYQNGNVYPDTNARTEEQKQQNIKSQAQLPNSSNLQLSLSFNKFYFYLLSWIVMSDYFLL